jgi:hypothetical protein
VDNKYEKTAMYWHILAARLAFIVVFEVSFRSDETDLFFTFKQEQCTLRVNHELAW